MELTAFLDALPQIGEWKGPRAHDEVTEGRGAGWLPEPLNSTDRALAREVTMTDLDLATRWPFGTWGDSLGDE